MKATDLRSKTVDELKKEILALMKERFNLRMQQSAGQTKKTHLMKSVRLNIARIKTMLTEKGSKV